MSTYEALRGEHEMVLAADAAKGKCLIAVLLVANGWSLSTFIVRRDGDERYFTTLRGACREYDRA